MSGLKILSAIKARSPETECILLTGHASQNTAIEAIQMGVYGYFQKPFDMEQVLLSIQRALEKSAAEKALRKSERFARNGGCAPAHLAILDETGAMHPCRPSSPKANSPGQREPHLKLCEGAELFKRVRYRKREGSEGAVAMAAGIRAVFERQKKGIFARSPCYSPQEKRWFTGR